MRRPAVVGRRVYGLRVLGLDDVPELPAWSADDGPGIEVEIQQRDAAPPAATELGATGGVRRLADGRYLEVRRDPGTATFYGPPLATDLLAHPYLAPVATTFNRWVGREAFHAGAFAAGGRAWVVVGERTAGKSSLLAALAGRGLPVISDDIVVTDGRDVHSGPRCIDLRDPLPAVSAAQSAGPADVTSTAPRPLATVVARLGTRLRVQLPAIASRIPLGGWVFLNWGAESLIPVDAGELLTRLARRRSWSCLASDPLTLLRLSTLPAWDLSRPRDWSALPATIDRLLAGVEVAAAAVPRAA